MIPVIDIFAGPGGLGEGFSAFSVRTGHRPFKVALSIEMEENARQTLRLRSFFRQFGTNEAPDEYYDCLSGEISIDALYSLKKYRTQAEDSDLEAMQAQLGVDDIVIHDAIRLALGKYSIDLRNSPERRPDWILIGGPPCQAYSLVGRSRMRSKNPDKYAADPRHTLYKHYLKIIAEYEPSLFVMENVKGILSSQLNGERVFDRILRDLQQPAKSTGIFHGRRQAAQYDIYPIVDYDDQPVLIPEHDPRLNRPQEYVVRCEFHGIPQRRHRVILIGVRRNFGVRPVPLEACSKEGHLTTIKSAIGDLPRLRSDLSSPHRWTTWASAIQDVLRKEVLQEIGPEIADEIRRYADVDDRLTTGSDHCRERRSKPSAWLQKLSDWFCDPRLPVVCNHSTRTHIGEDLQRYLFAACYARVLKRSPKISEFPRALWPEHRNIIEREEEGDFIFEDRFRVQTKDSPATTVTSHISKDGHYFIHYDPSQCRSLTVREAARLQTFPDNYFFTGPRTAQYQQVGNAVPPLLARDIAESVYGVLKS